MPWYKVPVAVYLQADGPESARSCVLDLFPEGTGDSRSMLATAALPHELAAGRAHVSLRIRELLGLPAPAH